MKGIIGKKVGMTQYFAEDGNVIPVTVIEAGPCYVTQIKTEERDGYTAIQLGFDEMPARSNGTTRLNQPRHGHLNRGELSVPDLRVLREFRVNGDNIDVEEGQQIRCTDVFEAGDIVDVIGTSKGRGFAGTVKRHNFNRQPKTHGQSDRERAPGSIGQSANPSRVFKGVRMGGRMGNDRITIKNLHVVLVDADKNIIAVKGSVPGARGGIVVVKAARKQRKAT